MTIASNIKRYMEEKNITVMNIVLNTSFSRNDIERILSGGINDLSMWIKRDCSSSWCK